MKKLNPLKILYFIFPAPPHSSFWFPLLIYFENQLPPCPLFFDILSPFFRKVGLGVGGGGAETMLERTSITHFSNG